MGFKEKIDALDLVINTLREHEKHLDGLINDLCETLLELQKVSLNLLRLNILNLEKAYPEEMPQWVRDLVDLSVVEKALSRVHEGKEEGR